MRPGRRSAVHPRILGPRFAYHWLVAGWLCRAADATCRCSDVQADACATDATMTDGGAAGWSVNVARGEPGHLPAPQCTAGEHRRIHDLHLRPRRRRVAGQATIGNTIELTSPSSPRSGNREITRGTIISNDNANTDERLGTPTAPNEIPSRSRRRCGTVADRSAEHVPDPADPPRCSSCSHPLADCRPGVGATFDPPSSPSYGPPSGGELSRPTTT
jgi:hypothetical protein